MSYKSTYLGKDISIPNKLNIVIALISIAVVLTLLWGATHTTHWYIKIICFIAFGFIGNTVFGLLHESVHSSFNTNKTVNYVFGNIFAALFPTGFSFQKSCHLNHHRQNRTDYEMFEAYHEKDSYFLKTVMLYFILTGVYWISPPVGAIWLMINPKSLFNSGWSGKDNYQRGRMGGAGMLRHLKEQSPSDIRKMRVEVLFSIIFQVSIFYLLDLTIVGWIICYLGFATQWSALQYADHAYSPRDIRNGAWNLRVSKITQWFYLNYHHHLAHHQHPHVPWKHLAKFVDFDKERPTFWSIYLKMWRGLVKIKEQSPNPIDKSFESLIDSDPFKS
ncbi:fatty acid desaturase [Halobacteriovorax sp. HLS]|uniref:fatty acid desaturase n=1 Tax=Halobacteriovorax sp. HLS TaxID=2234000 RepID=UPI000FDC0A24|nr:fatty acid desaturase [Halobacteriovorax sp. HLS]